MSAEQHVDGWHVWHERRTSRRRLKQAVLRTMSLTKNDLGRERTRNMTLHRDQTDGHRPHAIDGNSRRSLKRPTWRKLGANLVPNVPHPPRLTPMLSHASSAVFNGDCSSWVF